MAKTSFQRRYEAVLENAQLRKGITLGTTIFSQTNARAEAAIPDWQDLREEGRRIKNHALAHLDYYLEELERNFIAQGGNVFWAHDAQSARDYVLDLARRRHVKTAVKGKSMISEELGLNEALTEAGIEPVETDLGEFIVQLAGEKPSHIMAPAIHKTKEEIGLLFARKLNVAPTTDLEVMNRSARSHLREKFLRAGMGITGANFAVAETGTVILVENEGNIRYCTTVPPVLVSIMSIEKVIPDWEDLVVLLKLLIPAVTGQMMSAYVTFLNPPVQGKPLEGPEEHHLIILDNGRSRILASEKYRSILRCLRCGSCSNICPVYRTIGGHAYGAVYSGPMGSVLSPLLARLDQYDELPFASTLCSACRDICPVKIDLPRMLMDLRKDIVDRWRRSGRNIGMRAGMEFWSLLAASPGGLNLASKAMRRAQPLVKKITGMDAPALAAHRYEGKRGPYAD